MSDIYNEYTSMFYDLNTLPGNEDKSKKGGLHYMAYSNKAKTAEANADQKNYITINDIEVTRAHEVKEDRVIFDIKVKGISISNMIMQHYKNEKGEGDIIDFPQYKANNGKYYSYAWFPISKETREALVQKVIDKLN